MVKLVNDSTALLSMRESSFDTYSAYGEAIDNSIQAGASNIDVIFKTSMDGRKKVINEVAFIDDGSGMTKDVLHQCMQLGYSSRYGDRSGIGRFGVGMTLGAIHECRRIEVYSKVDGGEWNFTYVDIDEITDEEMVNIPDPFQKDLPERYSKYNAYDSGTVLIWKKYDRLKDSVDKVLEASEKWFGRTYRYFIWDGIKIKMNGNTVKAIDPLYVKAEKTRFPEDKPAKEMEPDILEVDVPEDVDTDKNTARVKIKYSLIDEKYRGRRGEGKNPRVTKRFIDENEGISILRNKREVFYDRIPYWNSPPFEEKDRYWGLEIHFPAELDSLFAVKNIKKGALPIDDLKERIADCISPFMKTMKKEISAKWDEIEAREEDEKKEESSDVGVSSDHAKATKIAEETPKPKRRIDREVDTDEAIDELLRKYYQDYPKDKLQKLADHFRNERYVIDDKRWNSPQFVDIKHYGGKSAIIYNTSHAFFEKYFRILRNIEDLDDKNKAISENVLTLMDLLLLSFSIAESGYDPSEKWEAEELFEDIKLTWGNELKKLFNTWSKKEVDDE